ncbi:MAG: SHOCT domain-containing protein [Deltaproteobacteria bacterium]|nr:SHOCT domain-containing protein [Deltaproteobacteria bacterium]
MRYIAKLTSCILIIVFLCFSYSFAQDSSVQKEGADPEPIYYTAYNIWKWPSYHMKCINYKGSRKMISAGTQVIEPKIVKSEDSFGDYVKVIRFKTVNSNKIFKIFFTKKYHPGKTIHDYLDYMFTTKKFEELTAGLSDNEISAIKSGAILDGMSKEAVLICYGPPPEHATHSLDSRIWTYWKNKKNIEKIAFNSNNRTGSENIQKTEMKLEEKILLLKELLDKGLITQEEYNKKKADLLESF